MLVCGLVLCLRPLGDFSLTKNLFLSIIVLSPIIILKGGKDETTKKFKAEADDP